MKHTLKSFFTNTSSMYILVGTAWLLAAPAVSAQTASNADYLTVNKKADRIVPFRLSDEGKSLPLSWGLDLAWCDESNFKRGINFMGKANVNIVRASFQPILPLVNGDLQGQQITDLNKRLLLIAQTPATTKVMLNCDHPSVHEWYTDNPEGWMQLIEATTRRVQARNREVVSIAPFNEPDYGWGQGDITDFYQIAKLIRSNEFFDDIRLCGGNTLNCDKALTWYNTLKTYLGEGNTHQLAGSFDSYAAFYQAVRKNGHVATNDELHNVMEAIVGAEYGMQTGIWWGTAEWTRSEFVRASKGTRLAYAEHRPNWTAAAVYRSPEGKVQAFAGTSERQAATTTYQFVSPERAVYFDGQGPLNDFVLELPGGTDYQTGQTNAEGMVQITWGDDIQPLVESGTYKLVNRTTKKVLTVNGGSMDAGAALCQNSYVGTDYQHWKVEPVGKRVGGDWCYYTLRAVHSGMGVDVLNFSLNSNADLIAYTPGTGTNQQWFLEYAGDNYFYIRSRHSSHSIDVRNGSTAEGAAIVQSTKAVRPRQQWRLLPIDAPIEFDKPGAPATISATPVASSVRLEWAASPESDVAGYILLRAETPDGEYTTLARNVQGTSFLDNTAVAGTTYYYKVKAVDRSLNRSADSPTASATAMSHPGLRAYYTFDDNLRDTTANEQRAVAYGNPTYTDGFTAGEKALKLDGSTQFVKLPATVPHSSAITVATRVYWQGGNNWQRLFDFGNGEDQYLFLTPRSDNNTLRFAIKNGGDEQQLNATTIRINRWIHLAVTLADGKARMYVDGEEVAASDAFTLSPADIRPVLNYVGRSQFDDPLFKGSIDDFRVYNYALSADEVARLAQGEEVGIASTPAAEALAVWPQPATDVLHLTLPAAWGEQTATICLHDLQGRLVLQTTAGKQTTLQTSALPQGIYTLTARCGSEQVTRKVTVK